MPKRRNLKHIPTSKPQTISEDKFEYGTSTPLKAKSHSGSGSTLMDHSLQAARMALTVSETLNVDQDFRYDLRIASFCGGLYHDLGKAAAGFQEMIKNYNVYRWPPKRGGYRHEILSLILFISNSIQTKIWKENKKILWAVYLSIIVHHKPFREKHSSDKYPKTIDLNQWPGRRAFQRMFKELLLNKTKLESCWDGIIKKIEKDSWGNDLLNKGWLPRKIEIPELLDDAIEVYKNFKTNFAIPGYEESFITQSKYIKTVDRATTKFITYVRAAVTVGDHLSSGNYLFLPAFPHFEKYQLFDEFSPRYFQKRCGNIRGNLLLRAPTGSGKTEAALHWLQNNQLTDDGRLGKFFYVLPYQASLNAMYERLCNWIGVKFGLIGLQHSRAAQVLLGLIEQELYGGERVKHLVNGKRKVKKYHDPWSEIEEIKTIKPNHFSDLLLDEGYKRNKWSSPVVKQANIAAMSITRLSRENFYPVKVTTPHQLLGALLHGRGWEISVQEFEEACFVFDEIHVYDSHLTGLILGMASVLQKQFNAKLMFMSASFPKFLIEKIKEYVDPSIPLIKLDDKKESDKEVLRKTRHRLSIYESTTIDLLENREFQNTLFDKDSVLIICNTVSVAQQIYRLLKSYSPILNDQIMLFHSRFKMKDRKFKEQRIMDMSNNELKIVVATQVVEVSLDIDFEFGIIEASPLDAMVQRFGRINRKGNRQIVENNVIVTQPDGYSYVIYDEETTNKSIELLKEVENTPISENSLVDLINKLYNSIGWSQRQEEEFKRAYGHEKYQEFFKTALPGTYSRWIDEVIVNDSSVDVLHHKDKDIYDKKLDKDPIGALDLLIPVRVPYDEYYRETRYGPNILHDNWSYSKEFGLTKEDS